MTSGLIENKTPIDSKDSPLGIEEPPSTELELHILLLSLAQSD
jgi:hypothetical protein